MLPKEYVFTLYNPEFDQHMYAAEFGCNVMRGYKDAGTWKSGKGVFSILPAQYGTFHVVSRSGQVMVVDHEKHSRGNPLQTRHASDISDFPVGWEIFPFDDFVYFRWKLTGDVLHFTTKQGWKDGKELGISKFDVTDHGGVVNQSGKFNVNEMELLLQRLDICQTTHLPTENHFLSDLLKLDLSSLDRLCLHNYSNSGSNAYIVHVAHQIKELSTLLSVNIPLNIVQLIGEYEASIILDEEFEIEKLLKKKKKCVIS